MCPSMTGKESHAMTVDTRLLVMIATTVNAVTEITAHNAVPIAKCVTPHFALDVLMSVPAVTNLSVRVVQPNVKNVKKCFVKTA